MKILSIIGTGVISIALFALTAVPSAFASEISIVGNGSRSVNDVNLTERQTTTVRQSNVANISNDVNTRLNTGNNRVSGNTGGDVDIRTGDARSDVKIENLAGVNYANVPDRTRGDLDVRIIGNGSRSHNYVDVSRNDRFYLDQRNDTRIRNNVDTYVNTGGNRVYGNTSYCGCDYNRLSSHDLERFMRDHNLSNRDRDDLRNFVLYHHGDKNDIHSRFGNLLDRFMRHECEKGSVSIRTGDARSDVTIHNMAGFNFAH